MTNSYLVTDVCDTLFFRNTSFHFLRYGVQKNKFNRKARWKHRIFLQRQSPFFWGLIFLNKLLSRDIHREIGVSMFRNMQISDINQLADDFIENELMKHKNTEVWNEIEKYPELKIVLASASFDVVVNPLAQRLNASHVSSRLEKKGDRFTGRLETDITGRKPAALKEELGIVLKDIRLAISDNTTDKNLLTEAAEAIAVCYTDDQQDYWRKKGANIRTLRVQEVGR